MKHSQWLYVTVCVLLIGPFSLAVVYSEDIYSAYVRTYVAPRLRRQYGFRLERRPMYFHAQPLNVYFIASIDPAGVFAKAGVREGDVPVADYHISDVALYKRLLDERGDAAVLQLINGDEYESMLKEGDLDLYCRGHKVSIPIRRGD